MLSGVGPMQTGHAVLGTTGSRASLQPVSLPALPSPVPTLATRGHLAEKLWCPSSVCKTDQTPQMGQSGRDVKLQSNQKKEVGMKGATLFETPDIAALSQHRNVGVGESAPPVKTGPDAFSPAASSQPVCRSQCHRRQEGLLPLKLRRQARLNGATDRGQGGGGGAPTRSISAPASPQGSQGRICLAQIPEQAPASLCGGRGRSVLQP